MDTFEKLTKRNASDSVFKEIIILTGNDRMVGTDMLQNSIGTSAIANSFFWDFRLHSELTIAAGQLPCFCFFFMGVKFVLRLSHQNLCCL